MDETAMRSDGQPRKIEAISGQQIGNSYYSLDVHLTHGLRGFLGGDGRDARANDRRFVLHPIVTHTAINGIGPYTLPELQRSEEHTSELPSLMSISYAVFCL